QHIELADEIAEYDGTVAGHLVVMALPVSLKNAGAMPSSSIGLTSNIASPENKKAAARHHGSQKTPTHSRWAFSFCAPLPPM
ncbi:MAG: hypothetical protein WBW99_02220, partial [Pseudolabrys sp.]